MLPFLVTWYGVFLMRRFFVIAPDDVIEAPRLDGFGACETAHLWEGRTGPCRDKVGPAGGRLSR